MALAKQGIPGSGGACASWEMGDRAAEVSFGRETHAYSPSLKPAPGESRRVPGPLEGPGAAAELQEHKVLLERLSDTQAPVSAGLDTCSA